MKILGISCFYHDSAACLIEDGEIIAAAQEERFTRLKHDKNFPKNAIDFCMKGIDPKELACVVFYEKPLIKFERILETMIEFAPSSMKLFMDGLPSWLNQKLFMQKIIDKHFGKKLSCPIYFASHHQSHAASAFYPSPFEKAAILCADAVGEWDTTSWGIGEGNKITFKQKLEFPHSLGMLYSAFTGFLGFRVNSGEYKVMGLAPYGEAKYSKLILDNLIDLKEDGSFKLNMDYFGFCASGYMFNKKFEELFKMKGRAPESELTQKDMDIAASVQDVAEIVILKLTNYIYNQTHLENLCLAGGCALNCCANGKILKHTNFKNLWIQPASGDAGGALGAALAVYYEKFKNKRIVNPNDSMEGSLLGNSFDNREIKAFLDSVGAKYHTFENRSKEIASLIAQGKIIGHFRGRMEFGPRALGDRSILADARNVEMQKKLNLAIKKRESFRPFAPTVLACDVDEIFDLNHSLKSPYMLLVANINDSVKLPVKEEAKGLEKLNIARSKLPAITHVDYSARIQTVDESQNPRYFDIINEFKKLTGYGVIVNTSFNVRGEPLVCTPKDAWECFMSTDMDILVLEDFILYKEDQPRVRIDRKFELD